MFVSPFLMVDGAGTGLTTNKKARSLRVNYSIKATYLARLPHTLLRKIHFKFLCDFKTFI